MLFEQRTVHEAKASTPHTSPYTSEDAPDDVMEEYDFINPAALWPPELDIVFSQGLILHWLIKLFLGPLLPFVLSLFS